MKKLLTILLGVLMVLSLAACGNNNQQEQQQEDEPLVDPAPTAKDDYASFDAAEVYSDVELLMSVQDHESWWDGKVTLYGQDDDGGYFVYEASCDEATANALTPGTLIRVKGEKTQWPEEDGEVEITHGENDCTIEIIAGGYDGKVYEPTDLTDLLGNNDELRKHMNVKAAFKNLTVVEPLSTDGDGYLAVKDANGNDVTFVVRRYLTPEDSEVATTAAALQAGDVIDVVAYVYWYLGPQPRMIEITKH